MSTLIIALPLSSGDTTTRYEHVLTPEGQSIAVHATSTANLLPDASRGADETVAVVPAEALSWHRVELPKGVGAGSPRLRPVLQSLLEDRLLDDPQDLHLACEPSPAADRGAFIDQSQSLNLFMESPNIGKLSSMYLYAWKQGLKTTYYLRSRPATRINQTNTTKATSQSTSTDGDAVSCSLENPESCDSCQ